jgi:Flp pilus assembly protein TadB
MARRAYLRASDADRDAIAERLRHATVEGRLVAEELEERLEAVFAARTYGELDAVVADLPVPRTPQRRSQPARRQQGFGHWVFALVLLAFVMPVLVAAVVAIAVFVFTGVVAVWVLWLALAWFFFGHRRTRYPSRRRVHGTRF